MPNSQHFWNPTNPLGYQSQEENERVKQGIVRIKNDIEQWNRLAFLLKFSGFSVFSVVLPLRGTLATLVSQILEGNSVRGLPENPGFSWLFHIDHTPGTPLLLLTRLVLLLARGSRMRRIWTRFSCFHGAGGSLGKL